jgi:transposase-like protein
VFVNTIGMSKKRKIYTPTFKSQVALEALKEIETVGQIASKWQVHPTQIHKWKSKLKDDIPLLFTDRVNRQLREKDELIEKLYNQVGKLTTELSWLKKKLGAIT